VQKATTNIWLISFISITSYIASILTGTSITLNRIATIRNY